jgi:hypothetical protein
MYVWLDARARLMLAASSAVDPRVVGTLRDAVGPVSAPGEGVLA